MGKLQTSIRISEEAKTLLEELSKKLGVSKTAIIELAVRDMAKKEKGQK
jgi:predicted DNA-binding protein